MLGLICVLCTKTQLNCQGAGLPLYSSFLVAFLVSKILYSNLNLDEKHLSYSFLHRGVCKTINRPMPSLLPWGPCSACSPMPWYSLTGELSHSCPMLSFACCRAHGSTLMTLQSASTQGGNPLVNFVFRCSDDPVLILSTPLKLTRLETFRSALPSDITSHIFLSITEDASLLFPGRLIQSGTPHPPLAGICACGRGR